MCSCPIATALNSQPQLPSRIGVCGDFSDRRYPTLDTAMRSVRVRAAAYLVKPPDLDELRGILRREVAAHRYRRAVGESRQHIAAWDGELARLEHLATAPDTTGPIVDYVQVTLRHLGAVLGELDRSVSLLGNDHPGRETLSQVDLVNGLRRTVAVLERTRNISRARISASYAAILRPCCTESTVKAGSRFERLLRAGSTGIDGLPSRAKLGEVRSGPDVIDGPA